MRITLLLIAILVVTTGCTMTYTSDMNNSLSSKSLEQSVSFDTLIGAWRVTSGAEYFTSIQFDADGYVYTFDDRGPLAQGTWTLDDKKLSVVLAYQDTSIYIVDSSEDGGIRLETVDGKKIELVRTTPILSAE